MNAFLTLPPIRNFALLTALLTSTNASLAQAPVAPSAEPTASPAESPASAPAPSHAPFVIEAGVLYQQQADTRVAVALPAPALALAADGARSFVALGEFGVAEVTVDETGQARVSRRIPISHGSVTGFMRDATGVWMQVNATSAIRLGPGDGAAPVTPVGPLPAVPTSQEPTRPVLAPATPADPEAPVTILRAWDGNVLLSAGKGAGVKVGQQFRVVRAEHMSDAGGTFDGERETAILVVDAVSEDSSRARIWRGDRVTLSDRVVPVTGDAQTSLIYPRHLDDFTELEVHTRPILNIGETGFALLTDANMTYHGEGYYVGLRSQPFGLGRTQGSTAFTHTTMAEGGYDSRPLAIGLGLGLTSAYGDLREMFGITAFDESAALGGSGAAVTGTTTDWSQELEHAFSLGQRVRLGAMDGLNLTVANTLLYFSGGELDDGTNSNGGFTWGGTNAKLTIPVALGADLFLEGGGGITGYAYGAVGIFGWLRGNGGPGSLGFMASAGGAGVWSTRTRLENGYRNEDDVMVAGPMVSFGVRHRFGFDTP